MNILIHTDEYYPTPQACAYRMQTMADVFSKQGNKVIIIASSVNKKNGSMKLRSEEIVYAPAISMKKKTALMRILNNLSFGISSVYAALKVGKIDIVISTSPPPLISIFGWIIAKFKRAKLVYDVRDIWPDVAIEMGSFSSKSFYSKIFSLIANFMYKHADWITTVSSGKVKKIQQHLISISKTDCTDKVKLVSNGFDEEVTNFKINQQVVDRYQLDKNFTCVYIGNIGLAQGLESILDIAEHTVHKDVQFLIFGKGAEKDSLIKETTKRKLQNVKFCGVLPHKDVFSVLSKAKISFIPLKSAKMKDSVPTKIYEALGIGCPVLLVAEGDSCDIVNESKIGKCISPSDLEILSETFDNMVDDYSEYSAHRNEAKLLMRNKYSRQKIAINFEKQLNILTK